MINIATNYFTKQKKNKIWDCVRFFFKKNSLTKSFFMYQKKIKFMIEKNRIFFY